MNVAPDPTLSWACPGRLDPPCSRYSRERRGHLAARHARRMKKMLSRHEWHSSAKLVRPFARWYRETDTTALRRRTCTCVCTWMVLSECIHVPNIPVRVFVSTWNYTKRGGVGVSLESSRYLLLRVSSLQTTTHTHTHRAYTRSL